jgi:hypothetical protein
MSPGAPILEIAMSRPWKRLFRVVSVHLAEDTLPSPERVKVTLVDVSGKVVRTVTEGTLRAGRHVLTAAAPGGPRLSSGVYYIVAQAEGKTWNRRVVVLR